MGPKLWEQIRELEEAYEKLRAAYANACHERNALMNKYVVSNHDVSLHDQMNTYHQRPEPSLGNSDER